MLPELYYYEAFAVQLAAQNLAAAAPQTEGARLLLRNLDLCAPTSL